LTSLYCNLVAAGEQAGILETLLDRLATYKEKMIAIKSKIKSALFYPVAIIVVAFIITAVIMIFVIPAFKEVFKSFGADLPTPTLIVIGMSDFFVEYWWALFGGIGGAIYAFFYTWKRSEAMQIAIRPALSARAGLWRHHSQVGHRPLDTNPGHHVRRRRALGRVAGFGRRCRRQLCLQSRRPGRSRAKSAPAPA
jgi:hypothetical protein